MTQVDSIVEGKPDEEASTVDTQSVHSNGMGDKSVTGMGPIVDAICSPKNPGPAGDSKPRVITKEKRCFRSKIPSPRSSPRYKASVKSLNVFENGDRTGVSTAVLVDFAEMQDWDDFLAEMYQGLDFPNHIEAIFTVKGKVLKDLETLKCHSDIVVSHGEPFRLGNYKSPSLNVKPTFGPLPATMSKSVQLRPTASASPLSRGRTRHTARGNFTQSVFLDNEEEFAAAECNPLTKTFSEQNVSYNHGSQDFEYSQLPNSIVRQTLTAKPRPVSCYSTATVNRIPSGERKNQSTHIVTQSKIPKRIMPTVNSPDVRNLTQTYTNPCIELTAYVAASLPSPVRTTTPKALYPRPDMTTTTTTFPVLPTLCSRPPRERLSRQEMIARREFVRPRLVTIIRSGIKPRKVSRYLLNQKTARSFEQVLCDITTSVKPDWGAIRRVYALSGIEVVTLEDFFKEERIFVVCPNDRVGPDDFQLEEPEVKAIQPFMQIPPSATKGKVVESRSPQRRIRERAVQATQERVPPKSYPTHPKFIPAAEYPVNILNRYFVGGIIGDGNFAVVRECTHRHNSVKYALKVIDKTKSGRDAPPDHEVTILMSVTHPNIIMLFEQFDFPTELYVVMEFVSGGDLFDTIAHFGKFSEAESACMTKDIASALSFLHSRGIVHRDIKPENLLVYIQDDNQKRLKLADFGLAQFMDEGPLFTICGTPTYVAPEILAETGYGIKVDVWAMGIILYILLCGYPPFLSPTGEQEDLFDLILVGDYEFPSEQWDNISEDGKDLIMRMIESDVDLRLEADEVLEHPWLASNAEDCDEKRNRFFRKDFKFSVFEQMGLTKLANNLGPFSTNSDSS